MSVWLFLWLMFALKLPIVGLYLIVRWAVRQTPDPLPGADGGTGPPARPRHPRPPLPRASRRGPHGERPCGPPARVRRLAQGSDGLRASGRPMRGFPLR